MVKTMSDKGKLVVIVPSQKIKGKKSTEVKADLLYAMKNLGMIKNEKGDK